MNRSFAFLILVALVFVMGSLYMPPMHDGYATCLAPGSTALCATPLSHREHWESTFSAVLLGLLAYALLFFVVVTRIVVPPERRQSYARVRKRTPDRPLLLQELFSNGILNRKEPCLS